MSTRYDPQPTLDDIDRRLTNVERLLIEVHASQVPRWLRLGGWGSIIGAVLGVAVRVALLK